MSVQVVNRGAEVWELTRVTELWKGTHEYELIGRVIRSVDDGLYYAELPLWQDIGHAWNRVGKGRLIPRPLFKWIEEQGTAAVVVAKPEPS